MNEKSKLKMSNNLRQMQEGNNYFESPGDLNENNKSSQLPSKSQDSSTSFDDRESVEDYLSSVTSGVSYRHDPNYFVTNAGGMITTISKVKALVDDGYNIVKSSFIGEVNGNTLVEVEYEKLELIEKSRSR